MIDRLAAGLILCICLSACSLLPSGAPTASEFAGPNRNPDFMLVHLDSTIAKTLTSFRSKGLAAVFSGGYQPSLRLRSGDAVSTTIYEVTPVPLFGTGTPGSSLQLTDQNLPVGGHTATIPTQVIGLDGTISVPFGGRVKIAGLTPAEAGVAVAKALEGKATNPQAVVSLISSVTNSASVNGEVGRPGLIQLTMRGERVLDVVAAAGGARWPSYDSEVQLVRAGHIAKINLQRVIEEPRENVAIQPGDNLYVIHTAHSFSVMGSALKVAQVDFATEKVTLAEAVARSGGLNDAIANVGDVYLLRFEPREMVQRLIPLVEPYRLDPGHLLDAPVTPVAYHVDLRQASGYFISQAVQMRDKDVLLFTNADSVQLSKALNILRSASSIYYDFHTGLGNSTTAKSSSTSSTDTTN